MAWRTGVGRDLFVFRKAGLLSMALLRGVASFLDFAGVFF